MLRDGTDRQQLGAATMDSNNSSPSWDEAPHILYTCSNMTLVEKEGTNIPSEKEEKEMSFADDSDASSVIVKTVKRKPKRASKK